MTQWEHIHILTVQERSKTLAIKSQSSKCMHFGQYVFPEEKKTNQLSHNSSFNKFSSMRLPWFQQDCYISTCKKMERTEDRYKAKFERVKKESTSVQEYNPKDPCPAHISFLRTLVCSDKFSEVFNDTLFHLLLPVSHYTIFWEHGQELWHNRDNLPVELFLCFFSSLQPYPQIHWCVDHISEDYS